MNHDDLIRNVCTAIDSIGSVILLAVGYRFGKLAAKLDAKWAAEKEKKP